MTATAILFRRYLEACRDCPGHYQEDAATAWDALPLWLRLRLCWQAGWLDAVWEVSPLLGRILNRRAVRYLLLGIAVWVGALVAAVVFIAAGIPFDVATLLATTGGGAVGAVLTGHAFRR